MLLALVACQLFVLAAANPFHKYPFVFLLDVGNEELEKTNSEQIRVSVPGGSVALRYPAIGTGNTIGHVRVSGIDFGTDLKANIVDGGPGYKYVVLVFMGNAGAPYDAVVTIQTVADDSFNPPNIGAINEENAYQYESGEDENNGAEDLSDTEVNNVQSESFLQNSKAELMQSSSNVYAYAENESADENDDDSENQDDDEENDASLDDDHDSASNEVYSDELASDETGDNEEYDSVSNEKDIHTQYADNIVQEYDPSIQAKDVSEENEEEEAEFNSKESYSSNVYSDGIPVVVDSNLYSKYGNHDHLSFGEVYSQEEIQKNSRPVYQEDPLDYEDPDADEPIYNDESDSPSKYRDANNNNYIDGDDSYAVAY